MVKRRKERATRYHFDDESPDEDHGDDAKTTQSIIHRHIDYSFDSGRPSVRSSYLSLEETTPKHARVNPPDVSGPTIPDATLVLPLEDEANLNYQYDRLGLSDEDSANAKRKAKSRPLLRWIPQIDAYLKGLLRHEGRGEYTGDVCPSCSVGAARYRCNDCHDHALLCMACMVSRHRIHPLHRITEWKDGYFQKATLKGLGLRIQLGHTFGETCCNPKGAFDDDFVLIDISGIHEIAVDFCNCEQVQPHVDQILCARWYPATSVDPKTAATFSLLQHFHILSTQSKVSGYEFYVTLARISDNTGTLPSRDRYPAFMDMIRQWRHLKMLKRGGQGHDATATPGGCAVECPACPQPGKNLPDDWKSAAKPRSWLYKLFLSLDANFRLKRKRISMDTLNPSLNNGLAYVVEDSAYKKHLDMYGHLPTEKGLPCNNHNTVKLANMKDSSHLAATGVGTVDCARHGLKRPCSVGDLQKGERYVNMDYLLHSSLATTSIPSLTVSYDIACQYSVNLQCRFGMYQYGTLADRTIRWVIPKFHISAHQESCRANYSLHYLPECANVDGEAVKRGWALSNLAAPSTKEMGPGSRRDTLDDIFADQNWYKVTRLPQMLLSRVKIAARERATHVAAFEEYNAALPAEQTIIWKQAVEAWEANSSKPNLFSSRKHHLTQAAVRLQLNQEHSEALRRLAQDVTGMHENATDLARAQLLERQNILHRKIQAWADVQRVFLPAVLSVRARLLNNNSSIHTPQQLPLLLPSAASLHITCPKELLEHEWALRKAQAHDALSDICTRLELRYHMYHLKDRFIRGQRPNTRMNASITLLHNKLDANVARYRVAYDCLCQLSPKLGKTVMQWGDELRPLQDSDLRHLAESEDATFSESRRSPSWIWKSTSVSANMTSKQHSHVTESLQESLRVKWCKVRARANRWTKECILLEEEMRRVIAYHDWASTTWLRRVRDEGASADVLEGMNAYARRQSALRQDMKRF
ncbi:hypothetical protein GY45DRAFT_1349685 [Cubamyces sp. BRFM 1775]|nr:hypothetical protein GY45DRAFT_1349685 [Cubamyces sp. BRFM 1775]